MTVSYRARIHTSLVAAILFWAPSSAAFESKSGDWTFNMGGFVNAHAVYVDCDGSGLNIAGNPLLCTGDNAFSVSNGYSPASFSFSAGTTKSGYDVAATLAVEPGLTDNAAFNLNGDGEAYRAFLTVGSDGMGTILAGRSYGVFGIDAILQDMTLGGVGAPASVKSPLNTSLGGAGYGYIFADRLSQITYSYMAGFGVGGSIGVYQPLDLLSFGGMGLVGDSGSKLPGVHGKLQVDHGLGGFVSSTFLYQSVNTSDGADFAATAADLTATLSINDTAFAASGFAARGVGYYGLFIDAADVEGNPRDSMGFYVQATHTFASTKIGINYGESRLEKTAVDTEDLLRRERKVTAGAYHTLVEGLSLVAEASIIHAEDHRGDEMKNSAYNLGLALAF